MALQNQGVMFPQPASIPSSAASCGSCTCMLLLSGCGWMWANSHPAKSGVVTVDIIMDQHRTCPRDKDQTVMFIHVRQPNGPVAQLVNDIFQLMLSDVGMEQAMGGLRCRSCAEREGHRSLHHSSPMLLCVMSNRLVAHILSTNLE